MILIIAHFPALPVRVGPTGSYRQLREKPSYAIVHQAIRLFFPVTACQKQYVRQIDGNWYVHANIHLDALYLRSKYEHFTVASSTVSHRLCDASSRPCAGW